MKTIKLTALLLILGFLTVSLCEAQEDDNLVYLKVERAQASSFDETDDWAPEPDALAPVDGDFETRWSSELGLDKQWIYFDFGTIKTLSKVMIYWERAFAIDYELLVSEDAKSWRSVAVLENQDGFIDELTIDPISCRYVKLLSHKRMNEDWGISIWEIEFYGPRDKNSKDKPINEVFPNRVVKGFEHIELSFEDPLESVGSIKEDEFITGISYNSYHENELATEESDKVIEAIYKRLNARHAALVVVWYQDDTESSEMYPESAAGGRTPVDEALTHAINELHSLGVKVMLKPHIDVQSGAFRGEIYPNEEWFKNYKKFILHYAEIADRYNVELFCVGTELAEATMPRWTENWRSIISDVRKVYGGPLVYAANHDEYRQVRFWDALDFVGIDAYFPLTNKKNPSLEELTKAWEAIANELENWRKGSNIKEPIIFTELGYASCDGSNSAPWELPTNVPDEEEQAECLQAALSVLSEKPWFKGLYWWESLVRTDKSPLGYTPWQKKAEELFKCWYQTLN
jgi:RNase H-fold protein (predicted Holliday junction resolvase)